MHRNTFFLLIILAVVAALILGFNIGKNWQKEPTTPTPSPTPSAATNLISNYENIYCGISLTYPGELKILEATAGAIFNHPTEASQSVIMACQKEIPRPALPLTKIENILIGSVSAKLYHESSPKTGEPIDELIFTHPTNGLDIFVAGLGKTFNSIIQTLRIIN